MQNCQRQFFIQADNDAVQSSQSTVVAESRFAKKVKIFVCVFKIRGDILELSSPKSEQIVRFILGFNGSVKMVVNKI